MVHTQDANYPWLRVLTSRSAIAHGGHVIAFYWSEFAFLLTFY